MSARTRTALGTRAACAVLLALASCTATRNARGAEVPVTYAQVLDLAARDAPDVAVARANEGIALAGVGAAGILPNPSVSAGTSTQTARLSVGVSVPLLIFGQLGAGVDAGRAELATARVETDLARADVRAGAAHAFITLWRAQGVAVERRRAAEVARRLDEAVTGRVELGAAANVDELRAHSEHLRAAAGAEQATQLVAAASSELARWLGGQDGAEYRAKGPPSVPSAPPALAELRARIDAGPAVRRDRAEARAAQARAAHERALVRPALAVDLGLDAWDPTLCSGTPTCSNPPVNYRGVLNVEVPILNQRGPLIDREVAAAASANARASAEGEILGASLTAAYATFEAWTGSARALSEGVIPAAEAAAVATEESYALGRAPLVAVLDAERSRIDAKLSLIEARAQQADAWVLVEHAAGLP